jgi:hypothetical protein
LKNGIALEIPKVLEYIMDQGIQYEIVRKRESELKGILPSQKVSEESELDEQYLQTFKKLFIEEQTQVKNKIF